MSKQKRNDKPAALDHVLYEIEMLTHSLIALCTTGYSMPLKNAWLECFAIHARNLNEFFGKNADGKSYMQPAHFIPLDGIISFQWRSRETSELTNSTHDLRSRTT